MIIATKDAIKSREQAKEVAPLSARKRLEEEIGWRKKALEADKGRRHKTLQDPYEMEKQMNDYQKTLNKSDAVSLSSEVRNELWKKAKRLKDKFSIGMVSQDEMHPVSHKQIYKNGEAKTAVVADYGKMNSGRVVERNSAWYKKNENDLREYKRVMRVLEPDDPKATDYEKFRPKSRRVTK